MSTQQTFKAPDYKYPSAYEWIKAGESYPILSKFGFNPDCSIMSLLDDKIKAEAAKRKLELYYWDICLSNKLGKLYETYIFLRTNYSRGISYGAKENDSLNNFLFDYYAEVFYYHYFSVRDNIGQILNVFFNMNLKEKNVQFAKIGSLISCERTKAILFIFSESSKKASRFRNAFTHRFPDNQPDYRPEIINEASATIFRFGNGDCTKSSEFMNNIEESLEILAAFMKGLKIEFERDVESRL